MSVEQLQKYKKKINIYRRILKILLLVVLIAITVLLNFYNNEKIEIDNSKNISSTKEQDIITKPLFYYSSKYNYKLKGEKAIQISPLKILIKEIKCNFYDNKNRSFLKSKNAELNLKKEIVKFRNNIILNFNNNIFLYTDKLDINIPNSKLDILSPFKITSKKHKLTGEKIHMDINKAKLIITGNVKFEGQV